jgi:hypothetical protein
MSERQRLPNRRASGARHHRRRRVAAMNAYWEGSKGNWSRKGEQGLQPSLAGTPKVGEPKWRLIRIP